MHFLGDINYKWSQNVQKQSLGAMYLLGISPTNGPTMISNGLPAGHTFWGFGPQVVREGFKMSSPPSGFCWGMAHKWHQNGSNCADDGMQFLGDTPTNGPKMIKNQGRAGCSYWGFHPQMAPKMISNGLPAGHTFWGFGPQVVRE